MIELRGVGLTYRKGGKTSVALASVSLKVEKGQFLVLYGPSGSGKTSLLGVMAGLVRPTVGVVRVGARNLVESSDDGLATMRLEEVGVVFQENNLVSEFTAQENVELPLRLRGVAARRAAAEASAVLDLVGLGDLGDRRPRDLSGGQRQRVGIARAVIGGRAVLLADEPTGALDSENAASIYQIFKNLAESGVTVVVASHDAMVQNYSDRSVAVANGSVAERSSSSVH